MLAVVYRPAGTLGAGEAKGAATCRIGHIWVEREIIPGKLDATSSGAVLSGCEGQHRKKCVRHFFLVVD